MPTFTQIGTAVTVGSGGATSVTFTGISGTYTDLVLYGSTRDDRGAFGNSPYGITTVNGSAVAGASVKNLGGNGSSAFSESYSQVWAGQSSRVGHTANTFGSSYIYIPNYIGTTNKLVSQDGVSENNAAEAGLSLAASTFNSSAAITSFVVAPLYATTFQQYSTFYLYGVSNA
jgi:hypothetical protein